jgi:hypothetical protein
MMPKKVIDVLFGGKSWFGRHGSFHICNAVPFCLMWIV